MMMFNFKLTWRKWRWLWHVYVGCVSQNIVKILLKISLISFVANLLEYKFVKNYENRA